MKNPRQELKRGYARLLGTGPEALDRPGFTLVETALREQPEWANWLFPIWLFAIDSSVVCSVLPAYAEQAQAAFQTIGPGDLLTAETLQKATAIIDDKDWVQCELFFYPEQEPPQFTSPYRAEKLAPGWPEADWLLHSFDGGVFAVRDETEQIIAHAGIKKKGLLFEIAVGVRANFRRQGLGKVVVARALADILSKDKVPVYWPDSLTNTASYALARSLGFQKVAEMCFCAHEMPGWDGFPLE